ncbi:MAG: hypothetical protein KAS51_04160 [Candidatus Omnitrophica bacterium]|nr:hypothetical protein [Candidatus Omnitrophota bacterium]
MPKIVKVAVPLALNKEFDYSFPLNLKIEKGMRVLVDFKGKKMLGLVVDISNYTRVKIVKPILDTLDLTPSLTGEQIDFAHSLSELYPYSIGEFLFMFLPPYLKNIRKIDSVQYCEIKKNRQVRPRKLFLRGDDFLKRYEFLKSSIKENLKEGSVLICFPQMSYLLNAKKILEKDFSGEINIIHSQQGEKELYSVWAKTRSKSLVLGTRVSIFYYPQDLRQLIVEEENNPYYFQEEKPFHNLLDVAMTLSDIKGVNLMLSGDNPSLSTYKLIKEKAIFLEDRGGKAKNIDIVNMSNFSVKRLIGPVLIELIKSSLRKKKRIVVLWNKKGFSKTISCTSCGYIVKCSNCAGLLQKIPMVDEGVCPYCQRKEVFSKTCKKCKNGYLKEKGYGIDRIGYAFKKIFPDVRIDDLENSNSNTQIILSTSKISSYLYEKSDLDIGIVIDADLMLARTEYDATFNLYIYLKKLSFYFKDSLYVFTNNKDYYLFQSLNKEWIDFYELELNLRTKSNLPPFGLISKITLRCKNEIALLKKVKSLYNKLLKKELEVYGPFQEHPYKLRDKFRCSLIIKGKRDIISRKIIKEEIKGIRSNLLQLAIIFK